MRVYSSMPTADFVYQLRAIAINAKAHPLVLDQIDAIVNGPTDDEVEDQVSAAYNDGEETAQDDCLHEWRMARKRVFEELDSETLGLTEEQFATVMTAIDSMEPYS